ncbi:membrane-spanning 4-domains subfamily A member 4D-like isoform X1 [Dendropsophus ebraccatus]|uniref:membrane-spanning 4-domains subfamily A member 4D-like isoform X1 n=1 Tax=Dendropsophus ebraccatus TaxID=150705 RepID=UPI003831F193
MSSENKASCHGYETLPNDMTPTAPPYSLSQFDVPPVLPGCIAPPDPQTWKVPTVAPQWSFAAVIPQITESSKFYQIFLKGKPKALGIVLITAAILQIIVGIGLFFTAFSVSLPSGIPFWGPICYIIAGSLTIAAQAKPSICLIKGSLTLNIFTTVFSAVGLLLTAIDLAVIWCYGDFCHSRIIGGYLIDSFLIVTNLLLFCLSISLSVFGCRSLCHASSIVPQVFMIQNDVVISMPPSVFSAMAPTFPQMQQPPPPSPPPYRGNMEDNIKQAA